MDTTAALWLEIDQLHLKYLRHEDNVAKIELRSRLEARVKEYLSCVTQDRKFVSSSTGDILNNSVRLKFKFSRYPELHMQVVETQKHEFKQCLNAVRQSILIFKS